MFRSKSSLVFLLTSLLLYSSSSGAEIILKPVGPNTFGTVTGTVGLTSETTTEGTISAFSSGPVNSTELDPNGGFTLTVAADNTYSLYANLALVGVPGVSMNFTNLPAISEGETRQLDLTRSSGRLVGRVKLIGGTLDELFLLASSSLENGPVSENFSTSDSKGLINNQISEILLAMPSGISTNVSGDVKITTDLGCQIEKLLPKQPIILLESSNMDPQIVKWTVDVSNDICNQSLNGTFRIDGLDPADLLVNHQLKLSGLVSPELNLTEFGLFQFDKLIEGNYLVSQQSRFAEPFGELTYPDAEISVAGNTTYNAIHAVGMARGQVTLSGEWDYTNVTKTTVSLSGLNDITTANLMSANDDIDLQNGNYDLVLGVGNWDLQNYIFDFEEEISGVRKFQFIDVSMLPEDGKTSFPITKGQSLNLPETAFETFTTELDLVVEQQPGQAEVTIERVTITGQALLYDSLGDILRGYTTLFVDRFGPQDNRFLITVYGLPGTYQQMTASGTGSDGRIYSATFDLILGGDNPNTPDPLGCFGINKMKVHMADGKSHDKLYIQKASFRLPDDAAVDLNQDSVTIDVDGVSYDFPAGSFKQNGYKRNFVYKSAHGEVPHIHARLDFDKAEWKLKVYDSNITQIENIDGVDVKLTIGDYVGSENIIMHSKDHDGTKLKYKRKPKLYCRLGKKENSKYNDLDDDENDDEDQDD